MAQSGPGKPQVVPIRSTKWVAYLEENAAAVDLALSVEDVRRLDDAAPCGATAVNRSRNIANVYQ